MFSLLSLSSLWNNPISATTTCQADKDDSCKAVSSRDQQSSGLIERSKLGIEIDGERYYLDVLPAPGSKLVALGQVHLLGAFDIKSLINDFGHLGAFIRIAYNGVRAAGPKFTKIQFEIQEIGFSITNVIGLSAATVSKFRTASSKVLNDLQSIYEFLLSSKEEFAIETLSSISNTAKNMEIDIVKLLEELKKEEDKLRVTLEKTQEAHGEEESNIEKKAIERKELESQRTEQSKHLQKAWEKEREAENDLQELKTMENEAIRSMGGLGIFKTFVNLITSFMGGKVFDEKLHMKAAEEKVKYLEKKIKEARKVFDDYHNERLAALNKMTEFVIKLKDCEGEEINMAKTAVEALHHAITALKEIRVMMMQIIQFWRQMQQHSETLASAEVLSKVKLGIEKYSKDERLQVWTSTGFKRKAIYFYAGWVAMNEVCTEFIKRIRVTQKDLLDYIRENPTYEESRKNIKALAAEFLTKSNSSIV